MAEAQATTQVRNDGPDWTCPVCGEVKKAKGRAGHMKSHEEFRQSEEAMDRPPQPPAVRARRGYKPRGADTSLSPLQQIRREPTVLSGAGAYYLDKDGATIRDALIYYPNGATEAEVGRYGQNSEYYQSRQAKKGFKYLGATLGPDAIKELVSTLVSNRPDEIAITQYRMDECDYTLSLHELFRSECKIGRASCRERVYALPISEERRVGKECKIGKRRVGKECRSRWSPYH